MIQSTGNETIDALNRKLADVYGLDTSSNNPNYRIVWAEFQTEHRKGTFSDETREGIYLRTVTEVREVLKYPFWPERWVLETLQGNDNNPELMTRISYEPIWVYGNGNSDPNPDWEHTAILVNAHKFVERRKKRTEKDDQAEEDARFLKEKSLFKTIIQDNSEYLVTSLMSGAAVSKPNKEFGESDGK